MFLSENKYETFQTVYFWIERNDFHKAEVKRLEAEMEVINNKIAL